MRQITCRHKPNGLSIPSKTLQISIGAFQVFRSLNVFPTRDLSALCVMIAYAFGEEVLCHSTFIVRSGEWVPNVPRPGLERVRSLDEGFVDARGPVYSLA